MNALAGLGKTDRERLSAVLRGAKGAVSVDEAAHILRVENTAAAKMLARWAARGWLSRVRRGLYVPVPLESTSADVPLEEPWTIAMRLFGPSYIGGWSAAEHWGLTEQIFRTVVVITTQRQRDRQPKIKGTQFLLRTAAPEKLFGLKPVWRGQVRVDVSDPTRTVLDMLADPPLGGGIRSVTDMLGNYLRSDMKNLPLLLDYAERLGNGVVYKRLGYLLESMAPEEAATQETCRRRLKAGNSKLDPKLPAERLVTRWKLWVPNHWIKE